MAVTSRKGRAKPRKRTSRRMKVKKTVKRRRAAAAALSTPVFRKRVVKSAKAYSRKGKARAGEDEGGEA
jgi:stalled ribosome alternative rescue factor ArfA